MLQSNVYSGKYNLLNMTPRADFCAVQYRVLYTLHLTSAANLLYNTALLLLVLLYLRT